MPKVRILSGSQTGAVVNMDWPEAESAIAGGFAEPYVEPEPDVAVQAKPEAKFDKPKSRKSRER